MLGRLRGFLAPTQPGQEETFDACHGVTLTASAHSSSCVSTCIPSVEPQTVLGTPGCRHSAHNHAGHHAVLWGPCCHRSKPLPSGGGLPLASSCTSTRHLWSPALGWGARESWVTLGTHLRVFLTCECHRCPSGNKIRTHFSFLIFGSFPDT